MRCSISVQDTPWFRLDPDVLRSVVFRSARVQGPCRQKSQPVYRFVPASAEGLSERGQDLPFYEFDDHVDFGAVKRPLGSDVVSDDARGRHRKTSI